VLIFTSVAFKIVFSTGVNVGMGRDHTLFAKMEGFIKFITKGAFNRTYVMIEPKVEVTAEAEVQA
jgi:large subunit ribosomal protein L27